MGDTELVAAVKDEWNRISGEFHRNLIKKMRKRCIKMIQCNAIKY